MIPGVETYHPRETWQSSAEPVTGPAQDAHAITQPVAHYSAAANVPDGDPWDITVQQWLRNVQHYYLGKGYSIGYLFAIDWLGGVWELRGFDFRAAANAKHNYYTCPLIFLTDGDDHPTAEAWVSARAVWREFQRRGGMRDDFADRPLGHGELRFSVDPPRGTQTSCPGPGILADLHAGLGDLSRDDSPPPPDPEGDTVELLQVEDIHGEVTFPRPLFALQGRLAWHVTGTQWDAWGNPNNWRQAPRSECKHYTYVGGEPPAGFAGIWANA